MSTSESAGGPVNVEDLVGQRLFGRYLVAERIGRGGMATVYRASDEQLGRDVALKIFHGGLTSPEDLQRQEGEVRHLAGLMHPSLVTLYDAVSDDDGRSFLVLEYVRGQDLRTRLKAGPLSPSTIAALGSDVARALSHIHSRNLVHRDVSPGNILLPATAPNEHSVAAKLTDLGIARVIDSGHITATGTLIGTAAYLSPEQVQGRSISPATDIYSLGLVLLECLTGERAFKGTAMEAAVARLNRDPIIPGDVPASWRKVIAAMTAREPADRPTASEAAEALTDPFLGVDQQSTALLTAPLVDAAEVPETRVLDQPESSVVEWLRRLPRRWIMVAAALALLVVSVGVIVGTGSDQVAAPPSPTYPVIPGQLGVHLKQLEHEVAP